MRLFHAATAFAATSALALTLTACGGGSDNDSSDAPSSTPASSSATTADGAPAANAGATKDTSTTTGGTSTGGTTTTGGTGTTTGSSDRTGTSRCHTSGLGFSYGPGDGQVSSSDDQQALPVVLKNKTSATCTIQGFPGVDLKSASGTWSLTRSSGTPKTVTLAAGGSATFTLTYLPWNKGSGTEFKATSVVITPPNETTSATLAWPGGSVELQDGATHPGTYVGPVGG